jgi:N-acetylmuramoyl-L-alanine amidase
MTPRDRLKQRLLEGMAEDNLELIRNQPRGTIRRQRRARQVRLQRLRRALFAGGSLIVVAVVALVIGLRTDAEADRQGAAQRSVWAGAALSAPPQASQPAGSAGGLTTLIDGRSPAAFERGVIPLEVRTVAVDAGHGGLDGGTQFPHYGLLEKEITWDIAVRLKDLLEDDFVVVMTRDGDETVALKERTEIANSGKADLFVSIHINWLPDREARGIETYFAGATGDPFLEALAAAENRDSGFSVADTRRLLDGIYSGIRLDESRRLAEWIGASLFDSLSVHNTEVVDRGVMRAPFVVLVATEMPAVLAEVACISNDREARLLGLEAYRQSIAQALYTGIRGYALELNATDKGETS